MHCRLLAVAIAVALPSLAVAQSDKTLSVKAGATDAQVLDLRQDGQVNITIDGNVVADCKPLSSDPTKCEDIVSGPAGPVPITTLTGTTQATPDGMGRYPIGTAYTLQPRITPPTTAEACLRLSSPTTPPTGAWAGAVGINLGSDVILSLDAAQSTYEFQYRCFNEFGAGSSQVVTVTTQPGATSGDLPPTFACNEGVISASRPGFIRQAPPFVFHGGTGPGNPNQMYLQNFPVAGNGCPSGSCPMPAGGVNPGRYVSVGFRTPPQDWVPSVAQGVLTFIESVGFAGFDAYPGGNYITISTCPGDFRIPTSATSPEPLNDPTLGFGCRNLRPAGAGGPPSSFQPFGGIVYRDDGVTQFNVVRHECGLAPGQVYFLNIIAADPNDGAITAGEHVCKHPSDGVTNVACGMRSQWY